MIKVIASDLDGTLLSENHVLNEETYQAIKKAQAAGIRFLVATGRDYYSAVRTMDGYELNCDYIVGSGAEVRNADGEILENIPMDHTDFEEIIDRLKGVDINIRFCTTGADYIIGKEDEVERKLMDEAKLFIGNIPDEELLAHPQFCEMKKRMHYVDSLDELLEKEIPIFKVFISSPDVEEVKKVDPLLADMEGIASASSFVTNVELTNIKAQKGPVLKQYIEERGYSMDEVMVFGDSMNDYSMLSMDFGLTIAMENGMDEIKRVAKYVTKSNAENGVAYAIEKLLKENLEILNVHQKRCVLY